MVPLGGDANLDGSVDVLDYLILKWNYGKTGMTWAEADFNYDGAVNYYDMLIMKANFGQSIGT